MWNTDQIAYLAGIIDGEGTFYIGKHAIQERGFNARVLVVNTNEKLMNWLHCTFGGLLYSRKSKKNPHWKLKYEWILNKSDILSFCKLLLPYLICKKEQAELMIEFRETYNIKTTRDVPKDILEVRFKCYNHMKSLNQRSK